eukprot:51795-Prorocentrum_minimum.AAC.2
MSTVLFIFYRRLCLFVLLLSSSTALFVCYYSLAPIIYGCLSVAPPIIDRWRMPRGRAAPAQQSELEARPRRLLQHRRRATTACAGPRTQAKGSGDDATRIRSPSALLLAPRKRSKADMTRTGILQPLHAHEISSSTTMLAAR